MQGFDAMTPEKTEILSLGAAVKCITNANCLQEFIMANSHFQNDPVLNEIVQLQNSSWGERVSEECLKKFEGLFGDEQYVVDNFMRILLTESEDALSCLLPTLKYDLKNVFGKLVNSYKLSSSLFTGKTLQALEKKAIVDKISSMVPKELMVAFPYDGELSSAMKYVCENALCNVSILIGMQQHGTISFNYLVAYILGDIFSYTNDKLVDNSDKNMFRRIMKHIFEAFIDRINTKRRIALAAVEFEKERETGKQLVISMLKGMKKDHRDLVTDLKQRGLLNLKDLANGEKSKLGDVNGQDRVDIENFGDVDADVIVYNGENPDDDEEN
jgi:hypothetical protein